MSMGEYINSQLSDLIDEHIHNQIYRSILKRRLIDGVIFDELAYEFNYSVRQIKRIVYKGTEQLCKFL